MNILLIDQMDYEQLQLKQKKHTASMIKKKKDMEQFAEKMEVRIFVA